MNKDYFYNGWFHIPGYNGYQINPIRREVRSMKMMYADPGHVLKPVWESKTNVLNKSYLLTADNGKRKRVEYLALLENTFGDPERKPITAMENSTYLGARQKAYTDYYGLSHNNMTKIDLTKNTSSIQEDSFHLNIDHKSKPIMFYD